MMKPQVEQDARDGGVDLRGDAVALGGKIDEVHGDKPEATDVRETCRTPRQAANHLALQSVTLHNGSGQRRVRSPGRGS